MTNGTLAVPKGANFVDELGLGWFRPASHLMGLAVSNFLALQAGDGTQLNVDPVSPSTVRYAYRGFMPGIGTANEVTHFYARVDPTVGNPQQAAIFIDITSAQLDTQGPAIKVIHAGAGDGIYVAQFSNGSAYEAATWADGSRGYISTIQVSGCPNSTLFNALYLDTPGRRLSFLSPSGDFFRRYLGWREELDRNAPRTLLALPIPSGKDFGDLDAGAFVARDLIASLYPTLMGAGLAGRRAGDVPRQPERTSTGCFSASFSTLQRWISQFGASPSRSALSRRAAHRLVYSAVMTLYDAEFYRGQQHESLSAARIVVPIVMDLLRPSSVVDVGCGVGTWLTVFKQFGVRDILGIDGDYVDRKMLLFDGTEFAAMDVTTPLRLDRRFDLVQSLEVAEHLDPGAAETFVDNLVGLGDVVLFSAAIPFQGGTGHVNEQFLDYWARLFQKRGYQAIDCIRPKIWSNPELQLCYRQNTVIFEHVERPNARLRNACRVEVPALSLVHPEMYSRKVFSLLYVFLDLAKQLHGQGQLAAAEGLYRLILEHSPGASEVWHCLGLLAAEQGQYPSGLESLDKAIRGNPKSAAYYFTRSRIHEALGHYAKAEADLRYARTLDPALQIQRL